MNNRRRLSFDAHVRVAVQPVHCLAALWECDRHSANQQRTGLFVSGLDIRWDFVNLYIARIIYAMLALSIYAVSLLGMSYLFVQPERYLIWWSVLLSAPIFMSCMLLFSVLITWLGQVDADQDSSPMRRFSQWYYQSCKSLQLESHIAYMCIWLAHLHFVSGSLVVVIALGAYVFAGHGPWLAIAGLMVVYLMIIQIFAVLRRQIAPQARFDS